MKDTVKRSLYLSKTFLFGLALWLSVAYVPVVNWIYDGKLTKEDFTSLILSTVGLLGISNGRLRVNEDIRKSAETGTPIGLLTPNVTAKPKK
jgi:hypothetical protein